MFRLLTVLCLVGCAGSATVPSTEPSDPPTPPITDVPTPSDEPDTPTPDTPTVSPPPSGPLLPSVIPEVTANRATILGHAQECAQVLGPIPGFDCLTDADVVPIHVDGVRQTENVSNCDKPALLNRSCNTRTRAGYKMGTHEDGSPRPEVGFVFTCRNQSDHDDTPEGNEFYDVAMIGVNELTGAACFFQAFPDGDVRSFPSPQSGDTPDYGTTPADQVWLRPESTANINCQRCHNADAWIHSPWIDQLSNRDDPTQPIVPWTGSNDTPYHVVGTAFNDWDMHHFAIPDNNCTTCHRVGTGGCDNFVRYSAGMESNQPLSATADGEMWMPPGFTGSNMDYATAWQEDVDELLDCCNDPFQPACNRTPTPEGFRYLDPNAPATLPPTPVTPPPTCVDPTIDLLGTTGADVLNQLTLPALETCGSTNDFVASCAGNNGRDVPMLWTAPADGTYVFDTIGSSFDTVIHLRETCTSGNAELTCDDDIANGQLQSRLTYDAILGDELVIVVDGYNGGSCGDAVLNITGP